MQFPSTAPLRTRSLVRPLVVGAAAVFIVTAAGIWQGVTPREQVSTTTLAVSAPITLPTQLDRPAADMTTDRALRLLLVSTADQAGLMQAAIAEADYHRSQFGLPPLSTRVVVVDAAGSDAFAGLVAEWDAVRAGLGLPAVTIMDLRSL